MIKEEWKKFEKDIEVHMKKSNIFKNNLSYLVQGILTVFETRVSRNSKNETAESEIHNELDILDIILKFAFLNCTNTCRKDSGLEKKIRKILFRS